MQSTAFGIYRHGPIEQYRDGKQAEIERIPYDQSYTFEFDLWPESWRVHTYLRDCAMEEDIARELAYRYLTDPLYRYAALGIPRPLPVNHHNLIAVIDAEREPNLKAILGRSKAPGQIEVLAARLYARATLTFAMATAILEKSHYTLDTRILPTFNALLATRHVRVTADEWIDHIREAEGKGQIKFTR